MQKGFHPKRMEALKFMRFLGLVASQGGLFHLPSITFFDGRVAKVLQKRLPEKCQIPKGA